MITHRPGPERFHTAIGWLESHHSFSFGEHHDPAHMGFRQLRVINEDHIAPAGGFGAHPHRDMEILTYVIDGSLSHRDSMGNHSVIRPGEVQRMSAGTGVVHSEHNASAEEAVHLLQIWILPDRRGIEPGYEQREFPESERRGRLRLVASRDGREGSVTIHQDVSLHAATLAPGDVVRHELAPTRHAWLQLIRGSVKVNGTRLAAGDGLAVSDVTSIEIHSLDEAEILLFDLA